MRPAEPTTAVRNNNPEPEELRSWLALWRAPGIGPATLMKLVGHFDDPREILGRNTTDLHGFGLDSTTIDYLRNPDWHRVDQDIAWLAAPHHQLLLLSNPKYPALLREIPDPPPLLFVHGNPELLSRPQIAMVGSRNPSAGGSRNGLEFADYLASAGLVITSGLAAGIDTFCHQGALRNGGATVAVLGTGPDKIYPKSNQGLAESIVENGVLVTEFPVGTPPCSDHFPRRNRIISGLSLGTLVIEAAPRSGSLITARHALEQGREVFAIPGSIHNPLARGCHHLIRQGAKLVETGADILEELGAFSTNAVETNSEEPGKHPKRLDQEYTQLLECIGFEPVTIDRLVESSGLTPEAVSSMLLILELHEYVASSPGGLYNRIQ